MNCYLITFDGQAPRGCRPRADGLQCFEFNFDLNWFNCFRECLMAERENGFWGREVAWPISTGYCFFVKRIWAANVNRYPGNFRIISIVVDFPKRCNTETSTLLKRSVEIRRFFLIFRFSDFPIFWLNGPEMAQRADGASSNRLRLLQSATRPNYFTIGRHDSVARLIFALNFDECLKCGKGTLLGTVDCDVVTCSFIRFRSLVGEIRPHNYATSADRFVTRQLNDFDKNNLIEEILILFHQIWMD